MKTLWNVTFRVDSFECYDHGDPKTIYVEETP